VRPQRLSFLPNPPAWLRRLSVLLALMLAVAGCDDSTSGTGAPAGGPPVSATTAQAIARDLGLPSLPGRKLAIQGESTENGRHITVVTMDGSRVLLQPAGVARVARAMIRKFAGSAIEPTIVFSAAVSFPLTLTYNVDLAPGSEHYLVFTSNRVVFNRLARQAGNSAPDDVSRFTARKAARPKYVMSFVNDVGEHKGTFDVDSVDFNAALGYAELCTSLLVAHTTADPGVVRLLPPLPGWEKYRGNPAALINLLDQVGEVALCGSMGAVAAFAGAGRAYSTYKNAARDEALHLPVNGYVRLPVMTESNYDLLKG